MNRLTVNSAWCYTDATFFRGRGSLRGLRRIKWHGTTTSSDPLLWVRGRFF